MVGAEAYSVEPVIDHAKYIRVLVVQEDEAILSGLAGQAGIEELGMLLEEGLVDVEGLTLVSVSGHL